ncbi:MAG TPA: beta-L-arabinofuranosidase domain-containing protein, partial [Bryobacteraceae bacterium]|nr:beta-L-arabinofuranosidase domain-containing protein [Bryobacteraceae bacterium]
KDAARRGLLFSDSDVYKWLEAVAFVLESGDHPALRESAEAVIDDIAAAQEPSGYLNTYFTRENLAQRHKNMEGGHELYCLGHMVQAGIAWYRATGERKLLDTSTRMVEYVMREFGMDKKPIFEGHPEIELSLIELYRTTGDRRYLDLAGYFLHGDPRNVKNAKPQELVYLFTIKPFTERTKLEGHAVRAMYAASGATDYYLETGDKAYWSTLEKLWEDMVHGKMYLTGGVGSRASGEAFGEPYELPNQQAYTESCAAIGTMFWNWRMLQATGDSKYMDLFERSLYNGANSGLSLDGKLYCYRNPLELVGNPEDRIRNAWYDCTCCPPNLQRILASLPGYFYSTSKDGLWVHLFDNNKLNWKLEDGTAVKVAQTTRYPWDGKVQITVSPASAHEFTLFLRKPSWAHSVTLSAGGAPIASPAEQKGYFAIRRTWKPGDVVTAQFDMEPRLVASNPLVRENLGKVAVERGPLVYCLEGLDQPSGASLFDWSLDVAGKGGFKSEWKPGMLGGIVALTHQASRPTSPNAALSLYDELRPGAERVPGQVTLIPYYTFHNRDITTMEVWVPYRETR